MTKWTLPIGLLCILGSGGALLTGSLVWAFVLYIAAALLCGL